MPKDQPPGSSRRLQRCDVLSELRAFMSPQQLRAMPSFRTRLQARAMRCPISHPLSPPIPEFLDSCWTMFSEARASVEICKHKRRPLHFAPVVVTEVRPHETKQTRAHKQPAHETKQTRAQDTGERPHQTTQTGARQNVSFDRLCCVVPCVLLYAVGCCVFSAGLRLVYSRLLFYTPGFLSWVLAVLPPVWQFRCNPQANYLDVHRMLLSVWAQAVGLSCVLGSRLLLSCRNPAFWFAVFSRWLFD